jgi:hypothetical protein
MEMMTIEGRREKSISTYEREYPECVVLVAHAKHGQLAKSAVNLAAKKKKIIL